MTLMIKKYFITYLGQKEESLIVNSLVHPGRPNYKNYFPRNEKVEVHEQFFKLARGKAGKKNPNWLFETKDVASAEDRIDSLEDMVAKDTPEPIESPAKIDTKPKTTKKRGRPKAQVV